MIHFSALFAFCWGGMKSTLRLPIKNACNVETSYTDTDNYSNSATTRTYAADYALGGGVSIGATYFDVEQTANSLTRTDVEGIMTKLSVGF